MNKNDVNKLFLDINSFIKIETNSVLPRGILEIIKPLDNGIDYTLAITDTPLFLFLVLENLSDEEIFTLRHGSFEISSGVIKKIPFLTLDYGNGLNYDFATLTMKEQDDEQCNAINIITIDRSDFEVKDIRVIGVNKNIIKTIKKGISQCDLSTQEQKKVLHDVYHSYTTQEIHQNAYYIQKFGETE